MSHQAAPQEGVNTADAANAKEALASPSAPVYSSASATSDPNSGSPAAPASNQAAASLAVSASVTEGVAPAATPSAASASSVQPAGETDSDPVPSPAAASANAASFPASAGAGAVSTASDASKENEKELTEEKVPLLRVSTDGTRTLRCHFLFPYHERLRWEADFPFDTACVGDVVDAIHDAWPLGPAVDRCRKESLQILLLGSRLVQLYPEAARIESLAVPLCRLPPVTRAVEIKAPQLVFHVVVRPDEAPGGTNDRESCNCVVM